MTTGISQPGQTSKLQIRVRGRLRAIDWRTGKEVYCSEWKERLLTTVGLELVTRILLDEAGYGTGLTYCAVGDDDTVPVVGDTILTSEQARNAVTETSRDGAAGTFSTFFTGAEVNFYIKEAGMFGHSTASATPGSGVLFDHWLEDFDNTSGNSDIIIDYELTPSEG